MRARIPIAVLLVAGTFAVACKQQARPSLQEEQEALARVLQNRLEDVRIGPVAATANAGFNRLKKLSPPIQINAAAIDELENKAAKDPDNLDLRLQLLFTYERPMPRGEPTSKFLLARRRHILWLIQN